MSSSQDVTAYLYRDESNAEKIKEFFMDYKALYLKHSGNTKIYIGTCPGEIYWDDWDEDGQYIRLDFFPRYHKINWDVNVKFFTALLDNKLCYSIGVAVLLEPGYPHTIYLNEGGDDNNFYNWKKHEFNCEDEGLYYGSYFRYLGENDLIDEDETNPDDVENNWEDDETFCMKYPGGLLYKYIRYQFENGEKWEDF
jgi:hypothetical protein